MGAASGSMNGYYKGNKIFEFELSRDEYFKKKQEERRKQKEEEHAAKEEWVTTEWI